jgi:hypothetical protein
VQAMLAADHIMDVVQQALQHAAHLVSDLEGLERRLCGYFEDVAAEDLSKWSNPGPLPHLLFVVV